MLIKFILISNKKIFVAITKIFEQHYLQVVSVLTCAKIFVHNKQNTKIAKVFYYK